MQAILLRQGAKLVENINDIFAEITPQMSKKTSQQQQEQVPQPQPPLNIEQRKIIECLSFEPLPIDYLINSSGMGAEQVNTILLELELNCRIRAVPGGYVINEADSIS